MKDFQISIIIPVYKVEAYIENCLFSVISQSYKGNIECILIDDCTPDKSIKIAETIISTYKGNIEFRIIQHQNNKGLSEARNTGIVEAKGKYLYFLDSDDTIESSCIEKLANLMLLYNPDFVIGNIKLINHPQNKSISYLSINKKQIIGNNKICKLYSNQCWYMMAWNKLISKEFIIKNYLFFIPDIYHEDEAWSFKLASCANNMAICQEDTYNYYIRKNSITSSTISKKNIEDHSTVIQECIHLLEQKDNVNLYPKIRTLYKSLIRKLIIGGFDKKYQINTLKKINSLIKYSIKLSFPNSFKDFTKWLLIIFPVRISIIYTQFEIFIKTGKYIF